MSSRAAKRDLSYLQSIPLKDENRLWAGMSKRTRMDEDSNIRIIETKRLYENRTHRSLGMFYGRVRVVVRVLHVAVEQPSTFVPALYSLTVFTLLSRLTAVVVAWLRLHARHRPRDAGITVLLDHRPDLLARSYSGGCTLPRQA